MTIYDALKKDHRKVQLMLDRLVKASEADNKEWKTLVDDIRHDLIPHSRAEEAVFYNALREIPAAKDVVAHSYREHVMAEGELRTLGAAKAIDANWTSLAEKLKKDLTHHIHEEEDRVFTAAQKVFSDEEAKQIGTAFLKLKPEMMKDADSLVASTIDVIANLLPQRFAKNFRSYIHDARNNKTDKKSAA